ncbi:MAG: hypothetical protein HYY37_06585 [Candidatus Aenigmarchaeota archaeon]|nr:hypothetical protein [Candidatus Aenigmarchaeota archaeon]
MGYVRYKLPEETHDILRRLSRKLGLKESELSRLALMEYFKSLGLITESVKALRLPRFHLGKRHK